MQGSNPKARVDLPLKPSQYYALCAFQRPHFVGEAYQAVMRRTQGGIQFHPATFYAAVHVLAQAGLLTRIETQGSEREFWYQRTHDGTVALDADDRLRKLARERE